MILLIFLNHLGKILRVPGFSFLLNQGVAPSLEKKSFSLGNVCKMIQNCDFQVIAKICEEIAMYLKMRIYR